MQARRDNGEDWSRTFFTCESVESSSMERQFQSTHGKVNTCEKKFPVLEIGKRPELGEDKVPKDADVLDGSCL